MELLWPAISSAAAPAIASPERAGGSTLQAVGGEEPTDEALMAAYVAGDQSAFEALFRRYAPLVLGLGRRHLQSDDAARELVQQTFLRLHGARRDFRPDTRLHPWLMTIVMNLVRDQWRLRKRRPTSSLEHEPPAPPREGAIERMDAERRARKLHAALSQLPESQREVVELHWLQDRPFAEVARVVGSTEGAVRVRAHRAYAKLRTLLAEELP
ncbi:MAG: sigma-70 family RNA polymerase sigma factor [Myxococcales bacterium]|jgi:RNA polymerase sigma-70 factor (ECF subfamily)